MIYWGMWVTDPSVELLQLLRFLTGDNSKLLVSGSSGVFLEGCGLGIGSGIPCTASLTVKNDEGKVKQGPQRDLRVQSSVQLLVGNSSPNQEVEVLDKLATRSTWSELVDTGEVLGLLPGTFQQLGGHKRDISCSFTSSFLSPGHEMATGKT